MSQPLAQLSEIFSSFQGEGIYVGERQIFVRFAGCNLSCQYCDSPEALYASKHYRIETTPASKKFETRDNPVTVEKLVEHILVLDRPAGYHSALSLTGGEPLLQVDFLKAFLPELKKKAPIRIYLETNGVLPDHLAEVIELIDITAFDIKLPSATGQTGFWKEHKKALETAYLKEVFVKVVFTKESTVHEMDEAAGLIAAVDENIPLVLQPASPHGTVHKPTTEEIFAFYNTARRKLSRVRVIPQMHKLSGML